MKGLFSKWKSRGDEETERGTSVRTVDPAPANIALAAQMLYDCVHGVLSNGAALRGDDMSGFDTLLCSLNSSPPDDLSKWRYAQETTGFVQVLLLHKNHHEFIDICNQKNLGEALINALRLLRMLEIKQPPPPGGDHGVTFESSNNLCEIFRILCSSIQTVEQIRPVLTKLFCLTLQGFPLSGIHLQRHIADVVGTLCRRSLSSQIVWFLHDSQAIKFMVRSLQELVALETPPTAGAAATQARSTTLKGAAAEEKEIWLVAFESFANLLVSSYQFSGVLLGDLEVADGIAIFVHVVVNSRAERCMKIVSILFDLLIGEIESKEAAGNGAKFSEVSKIAPIFRGVLHAVLKLDKHIQGDEIIENLIGVSSGILRGCGETWRELDGETILQSLAFGFLTLCSSHMNMYVLLEQTHHMFATMVLCIPAFTHFESLVAVTKTLIFIGGEGRPSFEIMSLCAAVSVMLADVYVYAVGSRAGDAAAVERLSYVLSIFEEVLNGDRKHSVIFSICGLKCMIYEPIQTIVLKGPKLGAGAGTPGAGAGAVVVATGAGAGAGAVPNMDIFRQLIKIVKAALRQNAFSVISDIKNSGILELINDVICSVSYHSEDVLEFLDIPISIILSDQDVELEYVLASLCALVHRLVHKDCYAKTHIVLRRIQQSLASVSNTIHSFAVSRAWQAAKGFECMMTVLASLDGAFPDTAAIGAHTTGGTTTTTSGTTTTTTGGTTTTSTGGTTTTTTTGGITDATTGGTSVTDAGGAAASSSISINMNSITTSSRNSKNSSSRNRNSSSSSSSDDLSHRLACMRCVLSIFSVCLTNASEGYMFSYQNKANRIYFKDRVGYPSLADALTKSGVLLSAFVEDILNDTFSLVSGGGAVNGGGQISNPEGMVAVLDLLPHMRVGLAQVAIDLVEQTVCGQIDGSQVLVEAGVTRHLLHAFSAVLASASPSHPLREGMHHLLLKLCSEHLVLGDVASILRRLLRPELIVSADRMLLPPWQCVDSSGALQARSWYSVKLLNTLQKRTVRQQGTSYVSIGTAASYKSRANEIGGDGAYLSVTWSDAAAAMAKPFPIYGLTVSTWFQIEEQAAMKQRFSGAKGACSSTNSTNNTTNTSTNNTNTSTNNTSSTNTSPPNHPQPQAMPQPMGMGSMGSGSLLPLLALVSAATGVYLEVQVDVHMSTGRVVYKKSKGMGVALFKVPYIRYCLH
jgi:hypothetical protein